MIINDSLQQLEDDVASLIEHASSDKNEVSDQIEEIKLNVSMVKTGLTTKMDHLAVSES